ncbi:MAG: aldehyde ferredoxin oxidoreductase family protein [Proteobacteria bacterium]|nr:aldehyde ferredoxin oxidoreductase family protein [Pseudomonadota bacterium]MBU4469196.1 aldehyde ferredoxin oxidoreductase family protein [Pseudomonadota bacterium]
MYGWTGKILRIDLTKRRVDVEIPDERVYHDFVGGKGMAGYYLSDHVTRSWNDPEMPLIFFTGPLVGTSSPTSGRMAVMSRSPLTGTVADASVGGKFGTELKKAGWDGVILTGRAETLTGIEMEDDQIRLVDASSLGGESLSSMDKRFAGQAGSYAAIGPAAENGVKFANILFDGHYAAGRNGLGLVCAAKNLKYIKIRGSGKIPIHDPKGLEEARKDIFRLVAASPVLMGEFGISKYGTGALYDLTASRRMMPTDNFRKTFFEAASGLNAHAYEKQYHPGHTGCRGCHIRCKKISVDKEVLPEFETMNHFTALLGLKDISLVMKANGLCNDLGMDTISAGAVLSCYSEIEGRALLPDEILSLLQDMGHGRGPGKELGKGAFRYASSVGHPESAMTVKKLELPAYDPRGAYGMALGYALSTRGGCHLRAYPIATELLRKPVPMDRFTFSGKARMVKIAEDVNAMVDSLTACKFIFLGATLEEYARAFSAVTGQEASGQDLLKIGERIYFQERMMNSRNGFDCQDDDLPERFFKEPGTGSPQMDIPPIPRGEFVEARLNYYQIRGLDANGMPLQAKAEALNLPWKT